MAAAAKATTTVMASRFFTGSPRRAGTRVLSNLWVTPLPAQRLTKKEKGPLARAFIYPYQFRALGLAAVALDVLAVATNLVVLVGLNRVLALAALDPVDRGVACVDHV